MSKHSLEFINKAPSLLKKRNRKFASLLHWTEFKISMAALFNKALSQNPRAGRIAQWGRPKAGPPVSQLIDNQAG